MLKKLRPLMPTRDVLMVAGDEDEQAIRHMIEVCFQVTESECVVSSQLYTYQDERVVTFLPQDKDSQALLATLERIFLQGEYDSQKTLLDALHDEQQEDVFVASYSLYKSDDSSESTFSICSWTENVITLLPKTDRFRLCNLCRMELPILALWNGTSLKAGSASC